MTFTHALATNNYGCAKFIVDASAANGTHTTIASALTSASSGDTIFIRPGTYTENLTLKAGVNIANYICDSAGFTTNNVTIIGKSTFTAAGTVNICGVQLQTNSDFLIAVTGSAASIINLNNCFLNCSNNTGISITSSSSSARVNCSSCQGNLGTTGITYFASTSAGGLNFNMCTLNNTGGSSTANTLSSGFVSYFASGVAIPTTTSSTAAFAAAYSNIDSSGTNSTPITHGGTGTGSILYCYCGSGTASTISVGSGATIGIVNCDINTTNTNAITGAGTSFVSSNTFTNSGKAINTTTQSYYPNLLGTPNNTTPPAGFIGEIMTGSDNSAGSVTINTITNCTSITLTPGIWDVTGKAEVTYNTGVGITNVQAALATANNNFTAIDANPGMSLGQIPSTQAATTVMVLLGPARVTPATSTSYFLNCFIAGTSATTTHKGYIRAVRVG